MLYSSSCRAPTEHYFVMRSPARDLRCIALAAYAAWGLLPRLSCGWTVISAAINRRHFSSSNYTPPRRQRDYRERSLCPRCRRVSRVWDCCRRSLRTRSSSKGTSSEGATIAAMADVADEGYKVDSEVGKCECETLKPLKNRYFALRHGQSVANMEGVISSDPNVGAVKHGLTTNGRAQARAAATALIEAVGRDRMDSLVFISSGYLRARQTAEECRQALKNILAFEQQATVEEKASGDTTSSEDRPDEANLLEGHGGYDISAPLVIRQELRERAFGELDGTIQMNYNKVWPEDLKDGRQEGFGVESVCDVAVRIGGLVRSLEEEYEDACIVFSSHADTLQIAQCHIAGVDERLFSQYRFKNGEVRRLLQEPNSLPPPQPLTS